MLAPLSLFVPSTQEKMGSATIMVTNIGNSGAGTLRNAVLAANPGDAITFSLPANSVITLTTGEIVIDKNLVIDGSTAVSLTISGNNSDRVFEIYAGAVVTITDLIIANGNMHDNGGGIFNWGTLALQGCAIENNTSGGPSVSGGGIFNYGTLVANRISVSGNTTTGAGGGIYNRIGAYALINEATIISNTAGIGGGGIFNHGDVVVSNTAIVSNTASGDGGGGVYIYTGGTLNLSNSTLSGNTVTGTAGGGAIYQIQSGTDSSSSTILNSTIVNNSAAALNQAKSGLWLAGNGGVMLLKNSIVANNGITGNFSIEIGTAFSSLGYNLTNSTAIPNSATGDITGIDPLIGPMADNGGDTLTHGLLPRSPAIDGGDPAFAPPPTFDQRGMGFPRIIRGRVDIGAYENSRWLYLPIVFSTY